MAFGSAGDVIGQRGNQDWMATLPPWLRAQIRQVQQTTGGDGAQMENRWVVGDPYGFGSGDQDNGGNLRDANGNPVYQLGNWDGQGHNGRTYLVDPKAIHHDDVLGDVTDPSNVRTNFDHFAHYVGPWMPLLLAGAALAGPAIAGEAASGSSLGGVAATDAAESGGTLALNAAGTGTSAYVPTAGAVGGGLGAGTAGYDASGGGLLGSGASGGAEGSGGLLSGQMPYMSEIPQPGPLAMDSMVSGPGNMPWYQSMLQGAMNNPLGTARTVMGVYNMANAAFGNKHPTAGHPQYAGGGNGVAQGVPTLNIGGGNGSGMGGQFQQNPYLLMQMNSVPFMRGANGLLGL